MSGDELVRSLDNIDRHLHWLRWLIAILVIAQIAGDVVAVAK